MISRKEQSKIVDDILKEAAEFGSEEELKKYLKDHPEADPKHHRVVKKDVGQKVEDKKRQLKLEKHSEDIFNAIADTKSPLSFNPKRLNLNKEEAKTVASDVLHDLGMEVKNKRLPQEKFDSIKKWIVDRVNEL